MSRAGLQAERRSLSRGPSLEPGRASSPSRAEPRADPKHQDDLSDPNWVLSQAKPNHESSAPSQSSAEPRTELRAELRALSSTEPSTELIIRARVEPQADPDPRAEVSWTSNNEPSRAPRYDEQSLELIRASSKPCRGAVSPEVRWAEPWADQDLEQTKRSLESSRLVIVLLSRAEKWNEPWV